MNPGLVVIHEHPDWQKPLFLALERRGVPYAPFDLKQAAFSNTEAPMARLYFNQASPSAYVRGNARAVPLALAYMRTLERCGARVLNGADVFALELSKSAQATLLHTLGIDTPRSITFNDVSALRRVEASITWPALLKPDQGGSGARIQVVNSMADVEAVFAADPGVSRRIYELSRQVIMFQRATAPLIGILQSLMAETPDHQPLPELQDHYRDVLDHVLRLSERIAAFRALLQNALAVNAALVAQRQNDEMRLLTESSYAQNEQVKRISSWAAILFAPTLIGTIYGMNFRSMPELDWVFGYPMALGLMIGMGVALYWTFKRNKWI